jgi:hypothetical protein
VWYFLFGTNDRLGTDTIGEVQMRRWIYIVLLVVAFVLTIYITSYISRLPESNCVTGPISAIWSSDHLYKATLLKKDCDDGETVFFSVRIDKPNTPTGGWFFVQLVEEDPESFTPPIIKWASHKLEIEIPAEMMTGSIERRIGDLTIARLYVRHSS